MAEKTAKEDITVTTVEGMEVVLVHAGQPVPDDIDDRKERARYGSIRTASAEEIEQARRAQGRQLADVPTEDKARRSSRQRKKK